ncbi:MAG: hypothetical protein V7774_08775 [Pseudorhizobium pelagicum]|uniref:hypothetical protein n=1 Tax=Pseudorhizobium pelagicum TaxID=1509405 RepID=UPI00345F5321
MRFKVLLRGNSIARSVEDWAILRAEPDDWADASLQPDLPIIYDVPNATEIAGASILSGPYKSSNFAATEWNVSQEGSCTTDTVILAKTANYDKGDSGAAVIIDRAQKRGVVAITSRFDTATAGSDSESIQLFSKLSRAIEQEQKIDSPIETTVLRELVKNLVFVKTVPIKCIVDQIISKDESLKSMFETEQSAVLEATIKAISDALPEDKPEKERSRKLLQVMNVLGRESFSIVAVMQIVDRFIEMSKASKNPLDVIRMQIFNSILKSSERIYAYYLPTNYIKSRISTATAPSIPPPSIFGIEASDVPKPIGAAQHFLESNSEWTFDPTVTRLQFNVSSLSDANVGQAENLTIGNNISAILQDPELVALMEPWTKAELVDSAVQHLALGLNGVPVQGTSWLRLGGYELAAGVENLGRVLKLKQSSTSNVASVPGVAERLTQLSGIGILPPSGSSPAITYDPSIFSPAEPSAFPKFLSTSDVEGNIYVVPPPTYRSIEKLSESQRPILGPSR